MDDVISINRNFLLLAKYSAREKIGTLLTGIPAGLLTRIEGMDFEQIDLLARNLPVSAITMRFNEFEIDRMISGITPGSKLGNTRQYALSLISAR